MYTKLYGTLPDSSLWQTDYPTRIVFTTFLAIANQDGMVRLAHTNRAVANRANIREREAEAAIRALESPDPISSDPANEGRRIERVQGGWIVLNYTKYRNLASSEEQRQQTAERVRKFREKQKLAAAKDDQAAPVTDVTLQERYVTGPETETDTTTEEVRTVAQPSAAPIDELALFVDDAPRPPPRKPGKLVPLSHPISEALAIHQRLFIAKNGVEPAPYTGKDAKLIQPFVTKLGLQRVGHLFELLFDSTDSFIASTGRTIGVFVRVADQLIAMDATGSNPAIKEGFDRWFALCLRKEAAEPAWVEFQHLCPDEALMATILDAQQQQNAAIWSKTPRDKIPMPATWLKQRRWNDRAFVTPSTPPTGRVVPGAAATTRLLEDLKRHG